MQLSRRNEPNSEPLGPSLSSCGASSVIIPGVNNSVRTGPAARSQPAARGRHPAPPPIGCRSILSHRRSPVGFRNALGRGEADDCRRAHAGRSRAARKCPGHLVAAQGLTRQLVGEFLPAGEQLHYSLGLLLAERRVNAVGSPLLKVQVVELKDQLAVSALSALSVNCSNFAHDLNTG